MAEPLTRYPDSEGDEPSLVMDDAARARETAEYLGDMIHQLESMSRLAGLDLLSYLLSMARVEAETNARAGRPRR